MRGSRVGAVLLGLMAVLVAGVALAAEPIRIGEISEAKLWADMAMNQRRGEKLALEEINAKGGVLGRPLEIIFRDGGNGTPAEVLRDVEELVHHQKVRLLLGTGPDNNGLAVSNYAKREGVFFLKGINGTNRHIWEAGHALAFRFDVPNYLYGKIFAARAAKLPARRWAFVGPDYEFGHSVIEAFQKELKALRPDVEFVATQWHPMTRINAGAVIGALDRARPDAVFVAHWGSAASQFVREGRKRRFFEGKEIFSVLLGQPEGLGPLKTEAPVGWLTQGYPYDDIASPAHKAFVARYRAAYGAEPGWFSFTGYNAVLALAKAIEKAGTPEPYDVATAMKGMTFESLIGPLTFREADNQSSLGLWIGRVGFREGRPVLVNWTYEPSDAYYPGDAYVKTVRPAESPR